MKENSGTTLTEQLKDIGKRLFMLRESMGVMPEKIADTLEVSPADYLLYEAVKMCNSASLTPKTRPGCQ
ncbi:hypothetical protein P6N53_13085 [Desulforamulus aquiferis]|uniref:HTH cro/C1-type domain-containing protein n=1 Tax=Desulforamulus aquiferis TaxID=1397668 RepID=A0AAW7ZFX2_9FIRM|nr:hypothetical protein [Desulforamulus aquiferis]